MTDLMATIQLPEEGIRQLLDAREQLEKGRSLGCDRTDRRTGDDSRRGTFRSHKNHWQRQREEKKHLVSTVIFSTH